MQSAFVNIGLERDAFLYVSDFLLEEEEDVDGLDQVVSRAQVIESPGPKETTGRQEGPIEADEILPPRKPAPATEMPDSRSTEPAVQQGHAGDASADEDRGGARKWRGRRRRRSGRGGFTEPR